MELKLRVESGKNAGQEIKISSPQFIIGRGDGCHLKAGSDMISRQHCMLLVADSYAAVRDLGSKNGTMLNGEVIHNSESPLKSGDTLRIGPLEFRVVLNAGLTGKKLPAVQNVREAVARSSQGISNSADDIASWLMDGPALPTKAAATDTQQMRLSDTEEIDLKGGEAASSKTTVIHIPALQVGDASAPGIDQSPSGVKRDIVGGPKKLPSKLPPAGAPSAANTRQAAADMIDRLRKRKS